MKILHLSRTSLAGAPFRLNQLLNKYSNSTVRSRVATGVASNIRFPVDYQVPFSKRGKEYFLKTTDELISMIEEADIIHIHNYPPFSQNSEAWSKIAKKKTILQLHSPPSVSEHLYKLLVSKIKIDRILVIAQYHAVYLNIPGMDIVRNIVDINDDYLKPFIVKNSKPVISYSPSNNASREQISTEWAYKSYNEVKDALDNIRNKADIVFHLGMPWLDSLKKRRRANIHIDEVSTGSYHLSSLEGLSQGKIVIANIAPWMEDIIKRVTGSNSIPWFKTTEDNILSTLNELVSKDWGYILEHQRNSRKWMEKYWAPEIIIKDYTSIYNRL